jgi:molybdate/tungstate transport system substrate-binding protein
MRFLILIFLIIILWPSDTSAQSAAKQKELIIFFAGSLSVPMKKISQEYEKRNPGTRIYLESDESRVCARKVTDLKKPCDILALSDFYVMNKLLVPRYASWSIRFATNEIVIAFLDKSKYAGKINSVNWMDVLQRKDVIYSRCDPDADPCGYRTIFTFMLAEKYYKKSGLTEKMSSKDMEYIRPKEADLVALLESNVIDYMFQYKSVAIQYGLKYIVLPSEINLSDPSKNDMYSSVSTNVAGENPRTKMKVTGDYINYSITILKDALQKDESVKFVDFLLSPDGMEIFRKNGLTPLVPFNADPVMKLPPRLLKYFMKAGKNLSPEE